MDSLVNLEELYISHNGIEEIEGLDNLVSLERITVVHRVVQSGL